MGHGINIKRDFVVCLYEAWHKLNEIAEHIGFTIDQNNPLARWNPVKRKLVMIDENGNQVETPYEMLVGSDDSLPIGKPIHSETYGVLTNSQFLELVEKSLEGISHKIQSCGSCCNRGKIFLTTLLRDIPEIEINNRKIQSRLSFLSSHDFSSGVMLVNCGFDTVCFNTFDMTTCCDSALKVMYSHSKNVHRHIQNMPQIVEQTLGVTMQFKCALEQFANHPMSNEENRLLLIGFEGGSRLSTRSLNKANREHELFQSGRGNVGKSLLDTWNGVTEHNTHESSGQTENRMKQFESSEFGRGASRKAEFFRNITRFEGDKENREILIDDDQIHNLIVKGEKLLADYDKRAAEKQVAVV